MATVYEILKAKSPGVLERLRWIKLGLALEEAMAAFAELGSATEKVAQSILEFGRVAAQAIKKIHRKKRIRKKWLTGGHERRSS